MLIKFLLAKPVGAVLLVPFMDAEVDVLVSPKITIPSNELLMDIGEYSALVEAAG